MRPLPLPLLTLLIIPLAALHAAAPSRPNFVVILGEGHGWSSTSVQMDDAVPASKSAFVRTPNLDKLARGGMRFADYYAPSPRCTPSRAALFTGKSPAQLHMTFIGEGKKESGTSENSRLLPPVASMELSKSDITIAELLKQAGYATAHFGKWHVGRVSPAQHGFDESDGATNNGGPDNVANPHPKQLYLMTDHGMDFMARQVKAGKPFYLQMSHYASRQGADASPGAVAAVKAWGANLSERESAEAAADTDLDIALGKVLKKIDDLGIASNTYIIFTTDHGTPGKNPPLAGGKGTVSEGGLRVPLIIRGPEVKAGACTHVRVIGEDLFPTIAALSKVTNPLPKGLEGGSFAEVLTHDGKGAVQRPREEFVVHFPHYDKDEIGPASAILLGDLKLIRVYETGALKLYNIAKDPGERRDLANEMPDKVKELNQRLTDYLSAVNAQMPKPNPDYNPLPVQTTVCSEVPAHAFDLILGRPTATGVTLSVLCYDDAEGRIAYGTQPGKLTVRPPVRKFGKGETAEIVLAGLQPDTRYFYQLGLAQARSAEASFHTARPPGQAFTFTIIADSHLDEHTEPAIYQETLANALAGHPDFHIDLGDTFMSEKHANREAAAKQYLAQRYYYGQLCQSAPLFLVLGNHDGESPRGRGSDADSLAVWSNTMRKRYFPNPVPDDFYTGDSAKHPQAGLLQDYYAWQWGDAQFIVLDPFWFTQKQRGKGDNWSRTLGEDQYQWLKRTLESGKTKYKFVFIHHLVGGTDEQSRGGAEAAPFYEWGGKNADGSDGFKQNRPGWPAPIHTLLLQNKVNIVFHGHDHFYAKQELDGIIYQEVPQPGAPGNGSAPRSAAEYGYKNGVIMGSSGHLRVDVSPATTTVQYIRAHPQDRKDGGSESAAVVHSYTVPK